MRLEAKAIDGLQEFLEVAPDVARRAAALAMNDVTGGIGLTRYKKAMRAQIAFPSGYLEDTDRFGQSQFATPDRLTTAIRARQRPTSLARFATGTVGREGATVKVKANRTVRLKKAFLVRLRAGTVLDGLNANIGLAVRLKPGQTLRHKRDLSSAAKLSPNVYLLYAPSVDQVFKTVGVTETSKGARRYGA